MKKTSSKFVSLSLVAFSLLFLSACETQTKKRILEKDGHYWQRHDTVSAIYLRGPKAQQRLNKHISECVVGVKELERLGAIQKSIPGKKKSSGAESKLSEFETPIRDGFNRREFLEYHDFESCMHAKGWERLEFVPYDVADESLRTFERVHADLNKPTSHLPQQRGDFNNLNE